MAEIEKYAQRLFEAYFSGTNTESATTSDKKIISDRYDQLTSFLDRGLGFLTSSEKQSISERIAERIKLHEQPVDGGEPSGTESIKETQQKIGEKEELVFDLNSDQLFDAIKRQSGVEISNETILNNLINNLKQLYHGYIEKSIEFTNFQEEEYESTNGPAKRYVFFFKAKLSKGKREARVKCTMNFTPIKKGVPGKQVVEMAPKFFLISVKK